MRTWQVRDVMTRDVATVGPRATYRHIVDVVTGRGISAVPVVDEDHRVLGVVSEADLLCRVEMVGRPHERRAFEGRRSRIVRAKAEAALAGDLMSAPAVTTYPHTPVVTAARLMDRHGIKRLPVVDTRGRLVGIVARRDLLKVHLRADTDIGADVVRQVLNRVLTRRDGAVRVEVRDGVVTLCGQLRSRSVAEVVVLLTAQVSGVVDVVDLLGYDLDDSHPGTPSRAGGGA